MFDDENEEPRIDLTSLIDVIFMLVIFFVMTMTFSSKPVLDIVLPESTEATVSKVPEELLVAVKRMARSGRTERRLRRKGSLLSLIQSPRTRC